MIDYDPTDKGEYATPVINVPTWVTIGQCEDSVSKNNNNMLVLNVKINADEEGAGYKTKEYLVEGVNWKIRQVLRACGLDPDKKHPIDDLFFRDREAQVIFKQDSFVGDDGETRTTYKIKEWVEAPIGKSKPSPSEQAVQSVIAAPEPIKQDLVPFNSPLSQEQGQL